MKDLIKITVYQEFLVNSVFTIFLSDNEEVNIFPTSLFYFTNLIIYDKMLMNEHTIVYTTQTRNKNKSHSFCFSREVPSLEYICWDVQSLGCIKVSYLCDSVSLNSKFFMQTMGFLCLCSLLVKSGVHTCLKI